MAALGSNQQISWVLNIKKAGHRRRRAGPTHIKTSSIPWDFQPRLWIAGSGGPPASLRPVVIMAAQILTQITQILAVSRQPLFNNLAEHACDHQRPFLIPAVSGQRISRRLVGVVCGLVEQLAAA